MRKRRIRAFAVILLVAVAVTAFLFRIPGYNKAGVHPDILALQQPYRSVIAHHFFDGGSVGVEIVDANGRAMRMALPVMRKNDLLTYPKLFLGAVHIAIPGAVEVNSSDDTLKFIAEKIDRNGEKGYDRNFALLSLRGALIDKLRVWWERDKY